ncbi:hypothetical protein EDD37DRAFT_613909 [Exophiala viscosa]|uniref:uncharacterized protein n=1 Tax=Exophiala viscosa TaxID=2486360 RepID=UPI002199FFC1|nr:hypothetical protein EDD37DRAFT_613909 [Exophiala viscosa]
MCRGEPTGQKEMWAADVVATAERDLKAGEMLDGEGGFTVYGKLMTSADSLAIEGLPIGLAHGFVLNTDLKKDQRLSWADVEFDATSSAVGFRREMETKFRKEMGPSSCANGHAKSENLRNFLQSVHTTKCIHGLLPSTTNHHLTG